MKKLLAVSLALALSGCGGGNDEVDLKREAMMGSDSPVSSPNKPDELSNWRYSSVDNSAGEVFNAKAENNAINTYPDPDVTGLNARSFVVVERQRLLPGTVTESIKIFAGSSVACTPTCQIPIKFNSSRRSYMMRYSTLDEVLVPVNDEIGKDLFDSFTQSNLAVVTLPIIGLSEEIDSEFNLRGYDEDKMELSIDSL